MTNLQRKILAEKVKLADAVIRMRNLHQLANQTQQEDSAAIAELARLEQQQASEERRHKSRITASNGHG